MMSQPSRHRQRRPRQTRRVRAPRAEEHCEEECGGDKGGLLYDTRGNGNISVGLGVYMCRRQRVSAGQGAFGLGTLWAYARPNPFALAYAGAYARAKGQWGVAGVLHPAAAVRRVVLRNRWFLKSQPTLPLHSVPINSACIYVHICFAALVISSAICDKLGVKLQIDRSLPCGSLVLARPIAPTFLPKPASS